LSIQQLSNVCILIPTLNEAEGIGPTIKEITQSLSKPEVVVIDANSDDGTSRIALDLGAKVIIQQGRGKGSSVSQFLQHVNQKTKYLAIIDGDYTYPANYIHRMLEILEYDQDVGMVTGDRFNGVSIKNLLSNPYYFGNKSLCLAHRILNGVRLKDPLTGMRVIRYELIRDFSPKARGFDIEVELNDLICRKRYKIVEVPIQYRPRLGKKKLKIKHGFVIFARIAIMAVQRFLQS